MTNELAEVFNLKNEVEEKQLWDTIGASVNDIFEFMNIITNPLYESKKEKQDKLLQYALTESIECYATMKKYFDRLDEGCTSASAISVPAGKISNKPIRRKSVEEGIFSKKKEEKKVEPKVILRNGYWSVIEDDGKVYISDGFIMYDDAKKCEKVAPKNILEKFLSLQTEPVYEAQIIDFEDDGNFTVKDEELSQKAVGKSKNKGVSKEDIKNRLEQNKDWDKKFAKSPVEKKGWSAINEDDLYEGSANYRMANIALNAGVPFNFDINGHRCAYGTNDKFGVLFVDGIQAKADNDVAMMETLKALDKGEDISKLLEDVGFIDTPDVDNQTDANDTPNPTEDEKKIEELKPAVGNDSKKISFIDKNKNSTDTDIETDATLVGIDDTTDVKKAIVKDKDQKLKMVSLDKVSLQEGEEATPEEKIEEPVQVEEKLSKLEEEEQVVYDLIKAKGEIISDDLDVLERLVADSLYKNGYIKIRLDKTGKTVDTLSPTDKDIYDMSVIDLDKDLDIRDINMLEKMGIIKKVFYI